MAWVTLIVLSMVISLLDLIELWNWPMLLMYGAALIGVVAAVLTEKQLL